jgi:hypothetical protein
VQTSDDAVTWCYLFDDPEVMRDLGNEERRDRLYYLDLVGRQQALAASTGLCLFSVVVDRRVEKATCRHLDVSPG